MVTQRTAKVQVHNNTGTNILNVSVGHKYSDNYKNEHSWQYDHNQPLAHGNMTDNNDFLTVQYNTGVGTTGCDWWVVSWVMWEPDQNQWVPYVTSPNNFRGIVDFLEGIGTKLSAPVATLSVGLSLAPEPVITKVVAAGIATTSLIVGGLCNSEKTNGFKMHTLRQQDAGEFTTIQLEQNRVVFISNSGRTETGFTRVQPNQQGDNIQAQAVQIHGPIEANNVQDDNL